MYSKVLLPLKGDPAGRTVPAFLPRSLLFPYCRAMTLSEANG